MRPQIVSLACGLCLVLGGVAGVLINRAREGTAAEEDARVDLRAGRTDSEARNGSAGERGASSADEPRTTPRRSFPSADDAERQRQRDDDRIEPGQEAPTAPSPGVDEEDPEAEVIRLRRENAELREEQRSMMGEPIDAPADLDPRFHGPSVSGAVQGALREQSVPGEVEGTDCSEHPCIVFGRLKGDEEDMEEVERAAALSPYKSDVLTLLFWATSVEAGASGPAAETGLFALAFYTFEDRARRGEELDRRIRARTMEYWNHDRPGQTAPGGP